MAQQVFFQVVLFVRGKSMPVSSGRKKTRVKVCSIKADGKARVEITGFSVRPSKGLGDEPLLVTQTAFGPAISDMKALRGKRGKDALGDFERIEFKVKLDFLEGVLRLNRYGSQGLVAASLEASCFSNDQWFRGFRFGLSGEGTAVLKLRLPGFDRGLTGYMNEEWWSHPSFPRKSSELHPLTRFLAWREKDGLFGCLLPLCGGDATSYLKGVPGGLELRVSTLEDRRPHVQA